MDAEQKPVERHAPRGDDFLSPEELRNLTAAKIIEGTRALKPLFRQYAEEAERIRRPVDHVWDALRKTGYFYMLVPKKYGGLEADIDDIIDASYPIAEGCASSGWLAMFGLVHNRHMISYGEKTLEELFGGGRYIIDAAATLPFGKAVKVEGGYRLSGHWKWATCITQADWVNAMAFLDTPNGPSPGMFMVPAEQMTVIDTWHTDGMRATGTHDVACEDLFVPDHRAVFMLARDGTGPRAPISDHPIYRVPVSPLLAFTTVVPIIGAARGAVELYRDLLQNHTKRGTSERQGDKQASQIRLARADTMVQTADILMRDAIKENLRGTELTGDAQIPWRCALRAKMTYATMLCREATILICEATGTSIHYLHNPLQRILRDMMVMTSHITLDVDVTMEQHGRGMLGLPPTSTIL